MIWKIIGLVVLAWIAFMIVGWLFKVALQVLILSAVIFGGYALYKAFAGKSGNPIAKP